MKKAATSCDSPADIIENATECPECGAMIRLDDGSCINCLLSAGLKVEAEASRQAFESVLVEANVTDTQWRLGNYEILEEIGRGGMSLSMPTMRRPFCAKRLAVSEPIKPEEPVTIIVCIRAQFRTSESRFLFDNPGYAFRVLIHPRGRKSGVSGKNPLD